MLQRAVSFAPLGGTLVINPTDLIGLKIQAYSNNPKRLLQDLADIQKMAELNKIDWEQVKAYAEAFGDGPWASLVC
jgi:predicted nucleotidyltransferase